MKLILTVLLTSFALACGATQRASTGVSQAGQELSRTEEDAKKSADYAEKNTEESLENADQDLKKGAKHGEEDVTKETEGEKGKP